MSFIERAPPGAKGAKIKKSESTCDPCKKSVKATLLASPGALGAQGRSSIVS